MHYLSIDAGGTKAAFAVCDDTGHIAARFNTAGITPASMNEAEMTDALRHGIVEACARAEISRQDLAAAAVGMPCYGESEPGDRMSERAVATAFEGVQTKLVNDAEVAWAGSFALGPGINVVCGTGTIAFGEDLHERTARCGGWSYHFGDEGSGYWLGKQLLHLFTKQADGRVPRSHVYHIVRQRLGIDNDFEVIDIAERDYIPDRAKVAGLQRWLLDAAILGDESAIECYRQAAHEIALCVFGIKDKLDFAQGPLRVSYSGGIFMVGELVMAPLKKLLPEPAYQLVQPIAPPWAGGLMMALRLNGKHDRQTLDKLIKEANDSCHL